MQKSAFKDEWKSRYLDRGILSVLFLLMGVGLVQIYSASFIFATEAKNDGLFFFNRQLIFTAAAILILLLTAYLPWKLFERWGFLVWWLALAGVCATFFPSLVVRAGGAARWIRLPLGFQFEPSELIKISFSILLATYLSRPSRWLGVLEKPLKAALAIVPLALVLKQPDFGSVVICMMVGLTVFFAFGMRWRYILGAAVVLAPFLSYLVLSSPYRRARWLTFLDPWADPGQRGFQVIQSMLSFHTGGLTGVGLGQSQGKLFFLPEAHTDFTLAILGEEMGFIGFIVVLALYGFLTFRGLQIANRAEKPFERALALGLTMTFTYSVFINMGVALGLLPTKGLTLPFLSYGGSSLLILGFMFGLLLNIERRLPFVSTGRRQRPPVKRAPTHTIPQA